jgi:hypothetical protein
MIDITCNYLKRSGSRNLALLKLLVLLKLTKHTSEAQVADPLASHSTAGSKDSRRSPIATVRSFEVHDRPPRKKSWQMIQTSGGPERPREGWMESDDEGSVLLTAASIDPERRTILESRPELQSPLEQPKEGHAPGTQNPLKGVRATTHRAEWGPQLHPSFSKPQRPDPEACTKLPSHIFSNNLSNNLPPTLEEDLARRNSIPSTLGEDLVRERSSTLAEPPSKSGCQLREELHTASGAVPSGPNQKRSSREDFALIPPTEVSLPVTKSAPSRKKKKPGLQTDVVASLWTESVLRRQTCLPKSPAKLAGVRTLPVTNHELLKAAKRAIYSGSAVTTATSRTSKIPKLANDGDSKPDLQRQISKADPQTRIPSPYSQSRDLQSASNASKAVEHGRMRGWNRNQSQIPRCTPHDSYAPSDPDKCTQQLAAKLKTVKPAKSALHLKEEDIRRTNGGLRPQK